MRVAVGFRKITLGVCLAATLLAGCAGQQEQQLHVKELTEAVTPDELDQLLKIIDRLPGKKLPAFDSPLAPPTRWALGQEKSIERIAAEKFDQLEQRWEPSSLVQYFNRNPRLRWALASAEMSPEVFSGLVMTVGVTLAKSSLPSDTEIEVILKRATEGAQVLHEDRRSLAVLPPDEQYQIAQQSLWIPLLDVMTHFPMVPEDSMQVVEQQRERLVKAFPPEFSENLLIHYDKILNSSGLPFEDLPETMITDVVTWNPDISSKTISGKSIEVEGHDTSDEAFTPPEHLFSSSPSPIPGEPTEEIERAEAGEGTNSAARDPRKDSAALPGDAVVK
ncbi:MAG: hypothetical protein KDA68_17885 [Planctomycetaceae bacterium]|nr:hypothetical protein [Planctomycetaceae bacterium]